MKKEGLTQKQKLFCLEYLKDFNATRSYKQVYWVSQKAAEASGPRLLGNVRVSNYLASKAQQKIEKAETGVEFVLDTLNQVIQIWLGNKSVELEEGKPKKVLDLSNVNSALEKLGKYHKMYTDKVEQDTSLQIKIVSFRKNKEWQN